MSDIKGHNLQLLYTLCQLVIQILPGQISCLHQGVQFLLQWTRSHMLAYLHLNDNQKTAKNKHLKKKKGFTHLDSYQVIEPNKHMFYHVFGIADLLLKGSVS